jgi:hypothetical protein
MWWGLVLDAVERIPKMSNRNYTLKKQTATKPSNNTVERSLLDIFGGNPYYAEGKVNEGQASFYPYYEPLTIHKLTQHLKGIVTLGSYPISQEDNCVRWLGWDIDCSNNMKLAREMASKIISRLKDADVPHSVEYSGNKGYHILISLAEPMSAAEAKQITEWVRDAEGFPKNGKEHVECYPKQSKLTLSSPMGNLLKIPLGLHLLTHNRSVFVDPENGWEAGDSLPPEEVLSQKASLDAVRKIIASEPDLLEQIANTIAPEWTDTKRHEMALALAGWLALTGWNEIKAIELIEAICDATGDTEKQNRIGGVRDTYVKLDAGEMIAGKEKLSEMITGGALKILAGLIPKGTDTEIAQQISKLSRMKGRDRSKSPIIENMIWADMRENGLAIRTQEYDCYWLNREDHSLIFVSNRSENCPLWSDRMHKVYGLNPKDNLTRLVMEGIWHKIRNDGKVVAVHKRTFWDKENKKLFVNFGGCEVYILDGATKPQLTYNGENDVLFIQSEKYDELEPDFDANPVDLWDYTVNDLNFEQNSDAPAKPDEQRELLKAWILCTYFDTLMPTRPIPLFLGKHGSGKTTAARRILLVIESIYDNVTMVNAYRQDSLEVPATNHHMIVLDNLERSHAPWMMDQLNVIATGAESKKRELYTTNQEARHKLDCFIALTSAEIPWSDDTFISRLLVVRLQKILKIKSENELQDKLFKHIPALRADLLLKLNKIVAVLKKREYLQPKAPTRLADFSSFCEFLLLTDVIDKQLLRAGIMSVTQQQEYSQWQGHPLVLAIGEYVSSYPKMASEWHTVGEISEVLNETFAVNDARQLDRWRWDKPNILSTGMKNLESQLQERFGMEKSEKYVKEYRQNTTIYRFAV